MMEDKLNETIVMKNTHTDIRWPGEKSPFGEMELPDHSDFYELTTFRKCGSLHVDLAPEQSL